MPKLPFAIATAAALCAAPFLSVAQTSSGATSRAAPPPTSSSSSMPAAGASESTPPAGASSTSRTTAGASTGTATNTSATGAGGITLSTGMAVKDNTGAPIGQISKLDTVNGTAMATIKMGAQSFQVPASNLGASKSGGAEINLTQAQIQAQLPK